MLFRQGYAQVWAESEFNDDLYDIEKTFGINFTTNGPSLLGGLSFKYARIIKHRYFQRASIDVLEIRHPDEESVQSIAGNNFTLYKHNRLYILRPQYGLEYLIFRKAQEKGIQVNLVSSIGLPIAIVAPYIIRYRNTSGVEITEQFDIEKHNLNNIIGRGPFLESISKSNLLIGLAFKIGSSFEFSNAKRNSTGIEVGFAMDIFTKKIVILQETNNRSNYYSVYLSFFFGNKKIKQKK